MPLEITFELSDKDLEFLKTKAGGIIDRAMQKNEQELIKATKTVFDSMNSENTPQFVTDRALKLQMLVNMLEDSKWQLAGEDRERVLKAIAYFADPEDLIPDSIPGLGFLDDAIMIELIVRELKCEMEAYQDFCKALERGHTKEKEDGPMSSEEWMEKTRKQMHERMRRRRGRRGGGESDTYHSPFALFS